MRKQQTALWGRTKCWWLYNPLKFPLSPQGASTMLHGSRGQSPKAEHKQMHTSIVNYAWQMSKSMERAASITCACNHAQRQRVPPLPSLQTLTAEVLRMPSRSEEGEAKRLWPPQTPRNPETTEEDDSLIGAAREWSTSTKQDRSCCRWMLPPRQAETHCWH